jgi:hypothetical protein
LQRKPANRLGLRGAQEVREHAWLKYYPWKDLYEKRIDSPFIPKVGDNFDAKYCNAIEKIGNDTREKYEQFLREDSYKDSFKDFSYYFNEQDPNDKNNSKEKKFNNPHLNIPNNYYRNSVKDTLTSKNMVKEEKVVPNSLETKFSKIKLMSSSGSSNSLIRNYRQSSGNVMSNNSTSSSNYAVHKRSGSAANLNY